MPTAIGGLPSSGGGRPSRARMSIAVTMRPRRFSTPAISRERQRHAGDALGHEDVLHAGDRQAEQLAADHRGDVFDHGAFAGSVLLVIAYLLILPLRRCTAQLGGAGGVGGLFLQRRDQAGTVELGDIVVEAGLTAALDRRRRHQRGQRR